MYESFATGLSLLNCRGYLPVATSSTEKLLGSGMGHEKHARVYSSPVSISPLSIRLLLYLSDFACAGNYGEMCMYA